ncbi:MAG: hypothetical protein HUU20_27930 [Pirellulales bacterium]|nr:hypothetical protein [Pirellulales bacterium]
MRLNPGNRRIFCLFIGSVLVFGGLLRVRGYQNEAQPGGKDGNSTTMLAAIRSDYEKSESESSFSEDGKMRSGQLATLLVSVVKKHVGNDKKLADRLADEAISAEGDTFRFTVLSALITIYCERDDQDALMRLLARWCPDDRLYSPTTIEGYLVIVFSDKLRDGTLVLCDAFDRSTSKDTRHRLATALRRGFTALGVESRDDAAFVRECRRWYLKNRGQYQLNYEYLLKGHYPDIDPATSLVLTPHESMKRTGLFVKKAGFEGTGGRKGQ